MRKYFIITLCISLAATLCWFLHHYQLGITNPHRNSIVSARHLNTILDGSLWSEDTQKSIEPVSKKKTSLPQTTKNEISELRSLFVSINLSRMSSSDIQAVEHIRKELTNQQTEIRTEVGQLATSILIQCSHQRELRCEKHVALRTFFTGLLRQRKDIVNEILAANPQSPVTYFLAQFDKGIL